jgi:hypothetical protein
VEILKSFASFLASSDAPASCDLIFVLAGRPERKPCGWQLFQSGLAPRLIFSVGRYEVRQTANEPTNIPELLELRDKTAPERRHFWVDFQHGNRSTSLAEIKTPGTFRELHALARYLAPDFPRRIAIVSTAIHLRRVRFCCERIGAFHDSTVLFLAVPEDQSSFRLEGWWKHAGHWSYLVREYLKLAAYHLRYRKTYSATGG